MAIQKTQQTRGGAAAAGAGAKKALGRGLGALIPNQGGSMAPREYFSCALDKIEPAEIQPRKRFDPEALQDLATSIKESGLIQPLVVREKTDEPGRYELIAGERRLRASRLAGLTEVPVVVKDVSDAVAFALALIENIQRQDLNPVEEAMAYRRLIDEFEFTQAELAEQVGKSRSSIANSVRLLGLPQVVLDLLANGEITSGHARTLLTLSEEECIALAQRIVHEQLTVRDTEHLVKELRGLLDEREEDDEDAAEDAPEAEASADARPKIRWRDDEATRSVVSNLKRALNTKVRLRDRHGRGRLEIHYNDYETLQRILAQLEIEGVKLGE